MNLDQRSIYKCVRCGTCRSVCPVFDLVRWESCNTRGRILVMKRLMEGFVADFDTLKSLNTCTTCGICTANCPAGVIPPEVIEEARRELVALGHMTEEQALLERRVRATGNTFGEPSERLGWLSWFEKPALAADYVYFVGCLDAYRYPETAARTFDILKPFGVALLPDEMCCGSPLLRTGFDASSFVDANLEQIERMGASTVITGCAGCYTTLKNDYLSQLEVVSVPEFLAEKLTDLDVRPLDLRVTYHDPCHLGRQNGIFEEPRQVIEAVCSLEEMVDNRGDSRCCGGGGGVRAGYRDLSLDMARRRLKDIPVGVDYIVTTCPMCVRNLRDAGGKAIDLVELVSMAMRSGNRL